MLQLNVQDNVSIENPQPIAPQNDSMDLEAVNTSKINQLKEELEDVIEDSAAELIPPSPVLCASNKGKTNLHRRKAKKSSKSTDYQENIKDICNTVPSIQNHFKIKQQIGSGTFSNVYLATIKTVGEKSPLFALKHIFSASHPKRTENEIRCLKEIGGVQHVVGIEACIRHKGEIVIVMPFQKHNSFSNLMKQMTLDNVKEYMRQLLLALQRVHQCNVIHRDVKPNNFLFDLETKTSCLVDFGLAQFLSTENDSKPEKSQAQLLEKDTLSEENRISQIFCEPSLTSDSPKESTSPQRKRRCLAEIQSNNIITREQKENAGIKKDKKLTLQHKSVQSLGNKKIPRFDQSCNAENLIQKPSSVRPHLPQLKFASLTPSVSLSNRSTTLRPKRSSNVTISDVFPAIKRYRSSKVVKPSLKDLSSSNKLSCNCFGKLCVCCKCLARPSPNASRAGTAGFRAPEVLMRYTSQTTAIDIWAAGVIFLSLLSGRCPFFRPSDDVESLSQLMLIFGSKKMQDVARVLGKRLSCSQNFAGLDMRGIVMALRQPSPVKGHTLRCSPKRRVTPSSSPAAKEQTEASEPRTCGFDAVNIPDSAFDLLGRLLDPNPHTRISALQALYHDFLITDDKKVFVSSFSRSSEKL